MILVLMMRPIMANRRDDFIYALQQQSEPYYLAIALGEVSGVQSVEKFGRNDNISSSEDEEIWEGSGTRVFLTEADTMNIVSTSVEDSSSGSGVRSLRINGLDSNYSPLSEDIALSGTTVVTTNGEFLRVHRAHALTVGASSNGSNLGDIEIYPTTNGVSQRQAFISIGNGQTQLSHYTVPSGLNAYLVGRQFSVGSADGTTGVKEAKIRQYHREGPNAPWRINGTFNVRSNGTTLSNDVAFTVPVCYPPMTDFKYVASAENNNTSVYIQYTLLLVDND